MYSKKYQYDFDISSVDFNTYIGIYIILIVLVWNQHCLVACIGVNLLTNQFNHVWLLPSPPYSEKSRISN